jgi:hypothetical protein
MGVKDVLPVEPLVALLVEEPVVVVDPPVVGGLMAGPNEMVALAVLVGSATLVAEIVTKLSVVTELGAE